MARLPFKENGNLRLFLIGYHRWATYYKGKFDTLIQPSQPYLICTNLHEPFAYRKLITDWMIEGHYLVNIFPKNVYNQNSLPIEQ